METVPNNIIGLFPFGHDLFFLVAAFFLNFTLPSIDCVRNTLCMSLLDYYLIHNSINTICNIILFCFIGNKVYFKEGTDGPPTFTITNYVVSWLTYGSSINVYIRLQYTYIYTIISWLSFRCILQVCIWQKVALLLYLTKGSCDV